MSAVCADEAHYNKFKDQMRALGPEFNKKNVGLLPKQGSDSLWALKGKTFAPIREFTFFKGKCIAVAWAPVGGNDTLGNRIVAGDQAGNVMILDAKKGARKLGYSLSGPSKFVQAVALHPAKDLVISGGMDNMISLYHPEKPDDGAWPFMTLNKQWVGEGTKGHDGMIASLRFHPTQENQFISAGGDGEIKIWDMKGGADCVATLFGHSQEANSITFPKDAPTGNIFGTCSNDTTCRLWDLRSNKCTHTFHATKAEDKLSCADFFPNGNAIAAGGQGQTTYMWDVRSVKCIAGFTRNNMKVTGCAFSKSGRALYVGHEDGRVIVWDTLGDQENQKYKIKFDAHFNSSDPKNPKAGADKSSQITTVSVKPDGEFLATAAFDGSLKIHGGMIDPATK